MPIPMLVEFVGLPGAGKTAIAGQIPDEMRRRGYLCGDRAQVRGRMPYAPVAQHFLRHRHALASAVHLGLCPPALNAVRLRQVLKLASWSYRLSAAGRLDYDLLVLDQGAVQQAWSSTVHGRLPDEQAIHTTLRRVLRGRRVTYAFVFVAVPVDVAVDRIRARPTMRSTYDRMPEAEARCRLAEHQRMLERLYEFAVQVTGAPHCGLDGTRPVSESAGLVADFLDGCVRGDGDTGTYDPVGEACES